MTASNSFLLPRHLVRGPFNILLSFLAISTAVCCLPPPAGACMSCDVAPPAVHKLLLTKRTEPNPSIRRAYTLRSIGCGQRAQFVPVLPDLTITLRPSPPIQPVLLMGDGGRPAQSLPLPPLGR